MQVAKLISLDEDIENHIIKEGGKKSDLTENEILAIDGRFDYSSWRYEGYLTSWDGAGSTAGRRPGFVTLMGGGGEIYRQKGIVFSNSDIDSSVNKLMNWYCKYNELKILSKKFQHYQRDRLYEIVRKELDTGVVNLQTSLYVKLRMNNWGAAHFQNSASPSVASLIDLELARQTQLTPDCKDFIHMQIIKKLKPDLLKYPLVNDYWECIDKSEQSSLVMPVKMNFPWQFQYAAIRGRELLDSIIENSDVLGDMLNVDTLVKLKNNIPYLQRSARLKMLYGAKNLISLFSGRSNGKPDFIGDSYGIKFFSNIQEDRLGRVLGEKFGCNVEVNLID